MASAVCYLEQTVVTKLVYGVLYLAKLHCFMLYHLNADYNCHSNYQYCVT